jgi:Bacterial protein of unknown function (DUF899)
MSAFALEDGVVFHTYSAYGRGVDGLWVPGSHGSMRMTKAISAPRVLPAAQR